MSLKRFSLHAGEAGVVITSLETHEEISIGYGYEISIASTVRKSPISEKIELYGIVGILKGIVGSYLIGISAVKVVARLEGEDIFEVEELIGILLEEFEAIEEINSIKGNKLPSQQDIDSEADDIIPTHSLTPPQSLTILKAKDYVQSTIRATNKSNKFTWHSSTHSPPIPPPPPSLLLSFVSTVKVSTPALSLQSLNSPTTSFPSQQSTEPSTPATTIIPQSQTSSPPEAKSQRLLDSKILKELLSELKGMYYTNSNKLDITRSYQAKKSQEATGIDAGVDLRFFYNRHLSHPLLELGHNHFVTILQQGFIASVSIPPTVELEVESFPAIKLILISRRSIERPGFRYQRRGVDEKGAVSNFVESEFIIRVGSHTSSFLQTRGSIPLYWTQSSFALKPTPVLSREFEDSVKAAQLHFDAQIGRYGHQVIVNLAEQTGKEAALVHAYEKAVESIGSGDIRYVGFDFHNRCKGMDYSPISTLILDLNLESLGAFWFEKDVVFSTQTGVVRTNCIDCLDRTSVVQSGVAKFHLIRFLTQLGLNTENLDSELDSAFRTLWADNGDKIAMIYSGTRALKSDFIRTGKRDLRGGINDAMNSISRLIQNSVFDYFKQAVVDYSIGINLSAFVEFESRLVVNDPTEIIRLSKIRAEAIQTAIKTLITSSETLVASWTFSSPREENVVKSTEFIEKILLLTENAIYVAQFDYSLDLVKSYSKISLNDLTSLQLGSYILGTDSSSKNTSENYGFLLNYRKSPNTLARTHSFTMEFKNPLLNPNKAKRQLNPLPIKDPAHFFAFKALRINVITLDGHDSEPHDGQTAKESIRKVVEMIKSKCEGTRKDFIWEKDLISVAEAEADSTVGNRIIVGIKRFIWY